MNSGYSRVLIKLSGESLKGESLGVVDHHACDFITDAIAEVYHLGIEIGLVVGGGNIFRGNQAQLFGFARTPADHVGMLATTINGLILGQVLSAKGCRTRIMSALHFEGIIEPYNWSHAQHSLEKGQIVIFVGGTGNPYFTTDTCAALRASEIGAEVLIKATKVDGIYDKDPMKHSNAIKIDQLTFGELLAKNLGIMDQTAVAMCRTNHVPIHVIDLFSKGALLKAVSEKKGGTQVVETYKEEE